MERPAQFAGKTLADITQRRWRRSSRSATSRTAQGVRAARGSSPEDCGARAISSSIHLAEEQPRLARGRSADGRIPPIDRRGAAAARRRVSTNANPRAGRSTAGSTWASTIAASRAASRLDDAGRLRQPLRHHAESGSVVIRYEMIHEARVIPVDDARTCQAPRRITRRRARLVGRQHAGRRDDQLPSGDRAAGRHREAHDDRAIHADDRQHDSSGV